MHMSRVSMQLRLMFRRGEEHSTLTFIFVIAAGCLGCFTKNQPSPMISIISGAPSKMALECGREDKNDGKHDPQQLKL